MNTNPPADYIAVLATFEAVRNRLHRLENTTEEHQAIMAELEPVRELLKANPHYQWLQEVQQDEVAAQKLMLSRLPRGASILSLSINPDDPNDPKMSEGPCNINTEDPLNIIVDARRLTAKQAAHLLRAAAARIENSGLLVSVTKRTDRPGYNWWVDEKVDGSVFGSSFTDYGYA